MRSPGPALILFGIVAASLASAQISRRGAPSRTVDYSAPPRDCPASTVPTDTSVASATDFVQLQRTTCTRGECPVYTVRVAGDGSVTWTGGTNTVVQGPASGGIDPNQARTLMQRLADRGFWPLCGIYGRTGGPLPTSITTLSIGGRTRRVEDNAEAAPSFLRALDLDIDRTANTHQWRHGSPDQEVFGDNHATEDTVMPKSGVTLLMRVASSPDYAQELPGMLANSVLNVEEVDSSGWDALMYASQAGQPEAVRMLLDRGADPTRHSLEGETALFAAMSSPILPLLKAQLLLARHAETNAVDHHGRTPLMIAALHPLSAPIHLLLQYGADPTLRDDRGQTALNYLDRLLPTLPPAYLAAIRTEIQQREGELSRRR